MLVTPLVHTRIYLVKKSYPCVSLYTSDIHAYQPTTTNREMARTVHRKLSITVYAKEQVDKQIRGPPFNPMAAPWYTRRAEHVAINYCDDFSPPSPECPTDRRRQGYRTVIVSPIRVPPSATNLHAQESSGDKHANNATFAASTSASLVSATGQTVLAIEKAPGDHMYGRNVLVLTNTMPETRPALEHLVTFFPPGCSSVVAHDVAEVEIPTVIGYMTLLRRTGVERTASSASNLTTIFELYDVNALVFESPKGHEPHGVGDQVMFGLLVRRWCLLYVLPSC